MHSNNGRITPEQEAAVRRVLEALKAITGPLSQAELARGITEVVERAIARRWPDARSER